MAGDGLAHALLHGNGTAGEEMLASLLDSCRELRPGELLPRVQEAGAGVGLSDVTVLLADRDQRVLAPLDGATAGTEVIDGSLAGRCYQRCEAVVTEAGEGSAPPGASGPGGHGWFPLSDGVSRIGVLGARLDAEDPDALAHATRLATLTGYLVASEARLGDTVARAVNVQPLTLAAEMRWATLPPLAFDHPRVSVGAMLQPAYEIAGDSFDYAVDDARLQIAVFDAMGHGLRASTLASLAVYGYQVARRQGLALEDVYRSIDEVVNGQLGEEWFVTAQLSVLDLGTGVLHAVSAGHPRPLLLRERRRIHELPVDAHLPIGLGQPDVEVTDYQLQPGDTVVYYSDGISEARSASGEQFGLERLQDFLVRAAAGELSPAETARRALHAVKTHHGDRLDDDATLVLVTWHGPPGEPPSPGGGGG